MQSEAKMTLRDYFKPIDDVLKNFNYSTQRKIYNMILGGIVCSVMFCILMLVCIAVGKVLVGLFFLIPIILFITALFSIKSGRVMQASYFMSIALLSAIFVPALFSARDFNPIVIYRITCFTMCMSIANYLISIKKNQLWFFFVISIVIIISTTIIQYHSVFYSDLTEWISIIGISSFGLFAGNMILITSNKVNIEVVNHSEQSQKKAEESIKKITNFLNKARESINVGQKLNSASSKASESVNKIETLYKKLVLETQELERQTKNIKQTSDVVDKSSNAMTENISKQNASLSEMSSAMTQISSNLSSIDKITEKRQAGMNEVIKLLDHQLTLTSKLVEEIEQVSTSSESVTAFVQTVDSIASQTSLLAMNASIEAAHAGENGKGFSVIAQEIRKLSEETSKNATKIAETLNQNNVAVKETADFVKEVNEATNKSTDEIKATIESIEEILSGIREMDIGTQDVMKSVNQIVEQADNNSKVIDEVVGQISEQSASIENITALTNSLQQSVNTISDMISAISSAMDEVNSITKENEEVSMAIAEILDTDETKNLVETEKSEESKEN